MLQPGILQSDLFSAFVSDQCNGALHPNRKNVAGTGSKDGFHAFLQRRGAFLRHKYLYCTRKASAVDSACASDVVFLYKVLCKPECKRKPLFKDIFSCIYVLQKSERGVSGLGDKLKKSIEVVFFQRFYLPCHTLVFIKEVKRAQKGAVPGFGTYFNGVLSGERNIFDIIKTLSPYGKIRLAVVVPEDAEYVGGINIFGKSCGDYPVDIVMTYYIR